MEEKDVLEALKLLPGGSLKARRVLEAALACGEDDLDVFGEAEGGLTEYYCELIEQGTDEAVQIVIREVQADTPFEGQAGYALGNLKDPARMDALVEALRTVRSIWSGLTFSTVLAQNYGARAVGPLVGMLLDRHNSYEARFLAADALSKIGGEDAFDALVETAADKTDELRLRCAVLTAMGNTHDRAYLPLLTKYLRHRNARMRGCAVRGLEELGLPEAAPDLLHLLEDPEVGVRLTAASTLVRLGDRQKLERLTTALLSHDGTTRYAAVVLLSGLDAEQFAPVLEPLLHDSDGRVRRWASRYMENLRERERRIAECEANVDDPITGDMWAEELVRLHSQGPRL
jgi:bilin biosynthesis protein